MSLLEILAWYVFGLLGLVLAVVAMAWWAKRQGYYPGPSLEERRERAGVESWRSS